MRLLQCLTAVTLCLGNVVPTIEIAPGVNMPMVAFGSYNGSLTRCSVQEGVQQWLQLGGRHVDTADMYETEADVGAAIRGSGVPRKDIFVTTKVPGPIGNQAVQQMILQQSLPKLGLDYLDLVLIHYPCLALSDFPNKCGAALQRERLDTWKGLMELRRAGKIRAIGVSNYDAEQVKEVIEAFKEAPAVNQVEWHLAYHNETLRSALQKAGVTIEAWASLAGPTSGIVEKVPSISLSDERLKQVAEHYGVSTAQVELRWETQKQVVPITATCTKEHALADLSIFNFTISDKDMQYLDDLMPAEAVSV